MYYFNKTLFGVLITGALYFTVTQNALAATPREKYSATVDDGTAKIVNALKPADENRDTELDDLKIESSVNALPKANVKALPKVNFDAVPKEKITEVAERIKYAYEILKKYGRAYDYKTTTLRELKSILSELEQP